MLDIAIIGGGPAGLTAGLYAMRGGADAALFEALFAGGQATRTHRIDNYPGFADGVEGFQLGEEIARQAARFGLEPRYATVERAELARAGQAARRGRRDGGGARGHPGHGRKAAAAGFARARRS